MSEIRQIRKRFGKQEVLQGVSFTFDTGCTAILGPNGAGKTTLLRCLAGLIAPDSGTVEIDGQGRAANRLPAGDFGYLPQHFDFFKELTVAESLLYLASLAGLGKESAHAEIERALAGVNLADKQGVRIKSLSGGMLRRLGIAQTLLGSPAVLLYDEPTTGLDPEERARFKALLMSLKARHRILLSTHIVDDVQQVCDKVLVLHRGRVLFDGTPERLKDRARNRVRVSGDIAVMAERSSDRVFSATVLQDGIEQYRFVQRERSEDTHIDPTLDEGYLCVIHGFDERSV